MRYIEGFHGIFRDYSAKPTTYELASYRKEFYDENPDVPRVEQNQFFSFPAIFIGVLVFLFGLFIKNDNIPMLGLSGAVLYNALKYIIVYTKCHYPKEEKSKFILPMVVLGPSLIVFVYNVLRILKIIPTSQLGNDILGASIFGWIGGVTLLMQLFYALKMNIKCRGKAEGTLIGYSDYETTSSLGTSHSVRHVVGSKYVYCFDVDGEEYTVVSPYGQNNYLFLRQIGSTHVIKYDPNNPEFCMIKHFEISSIISGLVVGLVCGWVALNLYNTIVNHDIKDPFGESVPTMPAIIVIDDDGVAHGVEPEESSQASDEVVVTEPSGTPTPTPIPLYSDEWINEYYDTDDYVCYVYPVVSIEGDTAYMGTVPGLYDRYVVLDDLEVGDEILFVNFRGSWVNFKLNEGESYTGTHTPENRGWVSDDGRFIFGEDYVDFYYGDGFEVYTYYVIGQDGDNYQIGCDEYYYDFNESYINDISNWNMERGHVYYAASNNQTVFIVDSDLFVLP